MPSVVFVAIGSVIAMAWGVAHLLPTRGVVAGFGPLSADNRRILTMEWVAEGLTLIFVGALPLVVLATASSSAAAMVSVPRASAVMLVIMAAWTALTGSRTAIVPMRVCPIVKTTAAVLMLIGTLG